MRPGLRVHKLGYADEPQPNRRIADRAHSGIPEIQRGSTAGVDDKTGMYRRAKRGAANTSTTEDLPSLHAKAPLQLADSPSNSVLCPLPIGRPGSTTIAACGARFHWRCEASIPIGSHPASVAVGPEGRHVCAVAPYRPLSQLQGQLECLRTWPLHPTHTHRPPPGLGRRHPGHLTAKER